ncbi:MAG: TetR/AcrR family transcriptional regulator [Chloroflexi bacterium]|nr:TetR/AcrR family transcriptional regulator [Chloroflexota bacterium]
MPAEEPKVVRTKVDRRILRTRISLRNALLMLIKEKDFDFISVEEITDRANLGRATFYLHYKDKEDLLLDEFREIASTRAHLFSDIPISIWRFNQDTLNNSNADMPIMPFLLIFEHLSQNADLYRILIKGKNSQRIILQLREIIVQTISEIINKEVVTESSKTRFELPEIPIELLGAYFSGAMMSSISWWLDQAIPPQPAEMADMFHSLFFLGVIKAWNVSKNNS